MNKVYGKTLQAIVLARYKKEHNNLKHCLIVCGINSLKYNWQREIKKFCKDEKAIVLGTRLNTKGKMTETSIAETKEQINSCPEEFFWIINIEKMRVSKKDTDTIVDCFNKQIDKKNLGMLIYDECHKCLDYNSFINTDKGLIKIGDIVEQKIKCNVLSLNENSNKLEYCSIVNYFKNNAERNKVIHIKTKTNELICSDTHKIFTLNKGWINASDLTINDEVIEFYEN